LLYIPDPSDAFDPSEVPSEFPPDVPSGASPGFPPDVPPGASPDASEAYTWTGEKRFWSKADRIVRPGLAAEGTERLRLAADSTENARKPDDRADNNTCRILFRFNLFAFIFFIMLSPFMRE
jgi:hypothetical protein